jgi:hypothetical protein
LEQDEGIVTHIIERDAAIYKADGIDIEHAKAYLIEHGSFIGYDQCDEIEVKDPLNLIVLIIADEKALHDHVYLIPYEN